MNMFISSFVSHNSNGNCRFLRNDQRSEQKCQQRDCWGRNAEPDVARYEISSSECVTTFRDIKRFINMPRGSWTERNNPFVSFAVCCARLRQELRGKQTPFPSLTGPLGPQIDRSCADETRLGSAGVFEQLVSLFFAIYLISRERF